MDINALIQEVALSCEIKAIDCEVAGMMAENKFREQVGQSVAYCEDAFLDMAERYRQVALELRKLHA